MTEEELKWEELEERIKELEKEKCELLGLIQGKDRDGYLAGAEPREKRIAELENENAELKEKLGDVQMQKAGEKSDLVWKLKTANEQKAEQLTKAKEIINNCVHELQIILLHKIRNKERIASILDKAEQFLEGE